MRLKYETVFGFFGAVLIALFLYVTYEQESLPWMATQKRMYQKAYQRAKTKYATTRADEEKVRAKYQGLKDAYSKPRIEIKQIVLRTLEVERCITCHVDEDELSEKHGDIKNDFPTEIYGCTVCHVGDGRSTEEPSAHYGLLRTRDEMLAAAIYAESPCAFCHVDRQPLLMAHPSAAGLDAGIYLDCTTCHVHKGSQDVEKQVLPHLGLRVNKEERGKVHLAFSGESPKTKLYGFWRRMRELTPPSSDPILAPPPTFREFNVTGDRLKYRGAAFCRTCHDAEIAGGSVVKYRPETLEHTQFWLKSKFRTFEIVKRQPDYINPPPTYPLDPFFEKQDEAFRTQCLNNAGKRPTWCPRAVKPDEYRELCWQCHTTGYDAGTHEYVEAGVTCEACHGPGEYFATLMQMGLNYFLADQDRKLKNFQLEEKIAPLRASLKAATDQTDQENISGMSEVIKELEKQEQLSVFPAVQYTDIEGNVRTAYLGTFYSQSGATISRIADDRNVCIRCHVVNYHDMRPRDLEFKRLEDRPGKGYQSIALGP
ncbi:MAG: multiheme c-type cytochrome, partial [bacterium]